jgi:hypothetical protein
MVVFVASWLVVDVDFKLLPLSCSFPFFFRENHQRIHKRGVTHNHKMSQIKMMMMMMAGK